MNSDNIIVAPKATEPPTVDSGALNPSEDPLLPPFVFIPVIYALLGPLLGSAFFSLYFGLTAIHSETPGTADVDFVNGLNVMASMFLGISLFACYPIGAVPAAITGIFFIVYRRYLNAKTSRLLALAVTAFLVEALYLVTFYEPDAGSGVFVFQPVPAVAALSAVVLGWLSMIRERKNGGA